MSQYLIFILSLTAVVVDLNIESRSLTDYLLVNLKPPPDVNGRIECSYSGKLFYLPPSTKLATKYH